MRANRVGCRGFTLLEILLVLFLLALTARFGIRRWGSEATAYGAARALADHLQGVVDFARSRPLSSRCLLLGTSNPEEEEIRECLLANVEDPESVTVLPRWHLRLDGLAEVIPPDRGPHPSHFGPDRPEVIPGVPGLWYRIPLERLAAPAEDRPAIVLLRRNFRREFWHRLVISDHGPVLLETL